ncbi:hypothetical protein PAXINDRAFT_171191 [Paxillus involutus ATCC 200175]|uniref:Uncharacterized protein n=1 Tax=Paxillus involutus ATCC 200175 TaxID=664439 RepID=A0A0C9SU38_PAXIN|nr:hypothetical protein PAXINDRAFT_171191 [Paxillus involutus ATCC 200175]
MKVVCVKCAHLLRGMPDRSGKIGASIITDRCVMQAWLPLQSLPRYTTVLNFNSQN